MLVGGGGGGGGGALYQHRSGVETLFIHRDRLHIAHCEVIALVDVTADTYPASEVSIMPEDNPTSGGGYAVTSLQKSEMKLIIDAIPNFNTGLATIGYGWGITQ